jgi:predicted membrane protein
MEITENQATEQQAYNPNPQGRLGRVLGGVVLVAAGVILLLRKTGVEFPYWVFSGHMFIAVVGLYLWARHAFRRPAGLIVMGIGILLLLGDIIPDLSIGKFIWPLMIIIGGLWMMLSPGYSKRYKFSQARWNQKKNGNYKGVEFLNEEDFLNSTSIFAGVKKRFFTKDFKGGKVVCIMGGTDIDLGNAEIQGPVTIEISQIFGGTKLILPPHWEVRSEIVAIAGGLEDKRHQAVGNIEDENKVLILRGTVIFGGIDIKSY